MQDSIPKKRNDLFRCTPGLSLICALGLALSFCGCRAERQEVGRDDAIRYYLNQGDYEQAIGLLKQRIAESPRDDVAKILLASAYSGSVGINTIDCFEVLRPRLFDKSAQEESPSQNPQSGSSRRSLQDEDREESHAPLTEEQKKQRAILAIEKELLKFAAQAADALDIAFSLPHTPLEDRDRIVLSMSILADIPEHSEQYLTAQLYLGILSTVQFVNYFRDAIPVSTSELKKSKSWYLNLYCKLDLSVLLPNLSKSVDFLAISFTSLANAGRRSENPIYANLVTAGRKLVLANQTYLTNQDLLEFADWSITATKSSLCE